MRITRTRSVAGVALALVLGFSVYVAYAPASLKELVAAYAPINSKEQVGSDVLLSQLPGLVVSAPTVSPGSTGTDSGQNSPSAGADELLSSLPRLQGWRTFAKPLPLGRGGLLLFQRSGTNAIMWHIDWKAQKVSSFPIPELKLKDDDRYTALATQEGLWLLGGTSLLIKPDGQRLALETGFNEPVAVVLNDQSVLALGHSMSGTQGRALYGPGQGGAFRMHQLRLSQNTQQLSVIDRGLMSYDGRPDQTGQNYRAPRYGHSAVTLHDGRVLLLGGDVTSTLASLIEPRAEEGPWVPKPVAPMPNERVHAAATALPDGRVVVVGAPSLRCYGDAVKVRSVDVYEPQNNRWSSLPLLPFVPCADAYGANAPSMAITPNGSIVVGAHLEPETMVLQRDAKSPTGYADSWQIYGHLPLRRISGVVQALSDEEIVVAGGVDNQRRDFGGCCYATSGFDRINITPSENTQSLAMSLIGAGVAKRERWVFAGSGRRFGFTGSGQMRYSAYAELIDLHTGKVEPLPNIPFASGAAQAFWLDDDRILLKGTKASNDRGFEQDDNLSSYMPPSSGAMAIYQVKGKRWSEPFALAELDQAQLIAAEGNTALLLSSAQQVVKLDLVTRKLEVLQQAQRGRRGGHARLIPQNRLVLAGGQVQSESVSVIDPDCEDAPGKDCAESFTGSGSYARVAMFETLSTKNGTSSSASILSATGPADVISTVISEQGRVIVLSQDQNNHQLSIARSNLRGTSWDSLPLPFDLLKDRGNRCGRCAVVSAPDPRDSSKDLIFFRQGAIDSDHRDDAIEAESMEVWLWSEAEKDWRPVLQSDGLAARSSPQALGEPLSPPQPSGDDPESGEPLELGGQVFARQPSDNEPKFGKPLAPGKPLSHPNGIRMMSMGWHLQQPVLWMEPSNHH